MLKLCCVPIFNPPRPWFLMLLSLFLALFANKYHIDLYFEQLLDSMVVFDPTVFSIGLIVVVGIGQ